VIKQANNNDKKRKVRDSGIDLIRILAMYAIIIHHILVFPNIIDKYSKYKELVLMKTSCFWHVSGFALISGYIGYKSNI
jgi:surface polysaccharide O-acyltransferase-like enzyme